MSSTYTPDPTNNPTSYTLPSDGDLRSAASVNTPFEGLADKIAHVDWPATDGTKKYPLFTRSITRVCPPIPLVDDFTKWLGNQPGAITCLVNTTQIIIFPVQLPNGSIWSQAFAEFIPAGGHAGLPGTMPVMRAQKYNPATNTATGIASVTDPSGTTGAYQAQHTLSITGMSETVDNTTYNYFIRIETESGANALAGDQFYGVKVLYVVAEQDPGAA